MKDIEIRQKVFDELIKIPKGKVTTYGAIAKKLGISPRQVGRILHSNKDPEKYPCHRVVYSDGKLSKGYKFGGLIQQMELLQMEGLKFKDDRILMNKQG